MHIERSIKWSSTLDRLFTRLCNSEWNNKTLVLCVPFQSRHCLVIAATPEFLGLWDRRIPVGRFSGSDWLTWAQFPGARKEPVGTKQCANWCKMALSQGTKKKVCYYYDGKYPACVHVAVYRWLLGGVWMWTKCVFMKWATELASQPGSVLTLPCSIGHLACLRNVVSYVSAWANSHWFITASIYLITRPYSGVYSNILFDWNLCTWYNVVLWS